MKTFKAALWFLAGAVVAVPILMFCACALSLATVPKQKNQSGNELVCKECFQDNLIIEFLLQCKKAVK